MARTADGMWKEVRKQTNVGPRQFPDGGPLRGRALLQGGAAVPGVDGSRQVRAEGEVTEYDRDASVVDYASEPEEEAEVQQARRLAQMETELGVLLWTCPGQCACAGCAVGSPRVESRRPGAGGGAGREARCSAGSAKRVHGRISFMRPWYAGGALRPDSLPR